LIATRNELRVTTDRFFRRFSKIVQNLQKKHQQERLNIKNKHAKQDGTQNPEVSTDGQDSIAKEYSRFAGSESELMKTQVS
jgi:hypothetical protein